MRTTRIEGEHHFAIPEVGFAFITNTMNWSKFWPGFVRLEEGSSWGAVGDTARLTTRLLGRERELTMRSGVRAEPAGDLQQQAAQPARRTA